MVGHKKSFCKDSCRMPMLWNFSQNGELFKEKECFLAGGLQCFLLRSVSRLQPSWCCFIFWESLLWPTSANDTQQQGSVLTLLLWCSFINGLCWWEDLLLIIAYWPQFSWVLQHFPDFEWKSVSSTIRVLTQSDWGWES